MMAPLKEYNVVPHLSPRGYSFAATFDRTLEVLRPSTEVAADSGLRAIADRVLS